MTFFHHFYFPSAFFQLYIHSVWKCFIKELMSWWIGSRRCVICCATFKLDTKCNCGAPICWDISHSDIKESAPYSHLEIQEGLQYVAFGKSTSNWYKRWRHENGTSMILELHLSPLCVFCHLDCGYLLRLRMERVGETANLCPGNCWNEGDESYRYGWEKGACIVWCSVDFLPFPWLLLVL